MNKTIKVTLLTLFTAILLGSFVLVAHAEVTNGDDDAGASTPSSEGAGQTTGSVTNGSDDVGTPSNSNPGSGVTTGAVTNGGDDISAPTNIPDVTVTPGGGGPGSTGGPGSGSTGSSNLGGSRGTDTSTLTPVSATSSCPLISSYLKIGRNNDPIQVAKLQAFLKNSEGINVTVTGIFDVATENAVKAFQKKYADTVLLPWGGPKTTGFVYITTLKKINQIACQSPLVLSASELSIIQAFIKNRLAARAASNGSMSVQDIIASQTNFGSSTIEDAMNGDLMDDESDAEANTASAGNVSFASRFWNYLVNLFR